MVVSESLIAAAPELLGLCEELLAIMDHEDKLRWRGPLGEELTAISGRLYSETTMYKALRITVAKAKGDAPANDTGKKLDKVGEGRVT